MDSTLLAYQNPWWENASALQTDPHLTHIRSVPYYFGRPELHSLPLISGSFHILRGPRQVGKTTLIKQWIEHLLSQKKVPNDAVLYLSCEGIETFQELQSTLAHWFEKKKNKTCFIFLDEICFVHE